MSDANKFINTYVDIAVGIVHDNLNIILQLKTQLKLANDLTLEKDQVISNLESEVERYKSENSKINSLENNARNWENEYNSMKNKVTHMDTLSNQYNDLKNQFLLKEKEIESLKQNIEKLKSDKKKQSVSVPKKSINKEDTKSSTISTLTVKEEPIETDDF
jgi:chromosome segregation ATPase